MTPEEAKLLCKVFVDTIQQETETTKKVMRAVPEGKKAYKPESKSMSARNWPGTSPPPKYGSWMVYWPDNSR